MINPLLYLLTSFILGTVFPAFPIYSLVMIPIAFIHIFKKRILLFVSVLLMFAAGYLSSCRAPESMPEGIFNMKMRVVRTLKYDYIAYWENRPLLLRTEHNLLEGDIIEGSFKVLKNKGKDGYSEYLRHHGILNSAKPVLIKRVSPGRGIERLRAAIINRINSLYDNETGAFLSGILIGYRRDIDPTLKEGFIHSGIVHMLAISGQHTAIFILLVNILLFPLPFPKKAKVGISSLITVMYALLTYMNPPVVRAAILICVVNAGRLAGRWTDSENAVILTACAMLLINGNNIYDTGFILSFLAVYAIVSAGSRFKTKNKAASYLVASLLIMLAASPVMFSSFGYMSLGSPLMTAAVLPFFNFILPVGALSVIPGLSFLSYVVNPVYAIMKSIVLFADKAPFLLNGSIDAMLAAVLVMSAILFLNKKGAASMLCSLLALLYSFCRLFY